MSFKVYNDKENMEMQHNLTGDIQPVNHKVIIKVTAVNINGEWNHLGDLGVYMHFVLRARVAEKK